MNEPAIVEAEHADVMRVRRDRSDDKILRDDCWHLRGTEATAYLSEVRAQDADRRNYWTTEAITHAVSTAMNRLSEGNDLDGISITVTVSDLVVTATVTEKEA